MILVDSEKTPGYSFLEEFLNIAMFGWGRSFRVIRACHPEFRMKSILYTGKVGNIIYNIQNAVPSGNLT
jgi:hypothetical protein